jgi:hypothetical protein
MTPEERFERIEAQLELLANFMSQSAERIDRQIEQLGRRADQTSRDVAAVAEAVATLARLFDRHTSNGHGGGRQQP